MHLGMVHDLYNVFIKATVERKVHHPGNAYNSAFLSFISKPNSPKQPVAIDARSDAEICKLCDKVGYTFFVFGFLVILKNNHP